MTGPKRTPVQRERDLYTVAQLYCEGWPQGRIGERLGVTQQQIAYDLRELNKRWRESCNALITEHKARQLARIDHIEAVAWEAWERSKENAETSSASLTQGRTDAAGNSMPDLRKSEKVSKGQVGDPRFLDRVCWCIEQRCKILGLYSVESQATAAAPIAIVTTDHGEPATVSALIRRMLANPDARQAAAELVELNMEQPETRHPC